MYLLLWCLGAGEVLADNVLLLRGVETLSIRAINPIPVLQVLSRNAKHSVSSMGISLEHKPDRVRSVSMGPALDTLTHPEPLKCKPTYLYSLCVCTPAIIIQ